MTRRRASSTLTLTLPATSANLGPAFDAAALAMSLLFKVRASLANDFWVHATGRDAQICRQLENHLIFKTYREVLEDAGKPVSPLSLSIKNEIPIGKGCGSSAAARLAGIALANHFGRLHWSDQQIIGEAARREDHPDNAAACWLGGLVVARLAENGQAQFARISPKGRWPLLLAIPPEALSTEQARDVLPQQYSRADAVTNIQNSLLLMQAFSQGRHDLISAALEDRIHQPYRAPLCPLLPCLQQLTDTRGVHGIALSGAGPSVLIFLDPKVNGNAVRRRIQAQLRDHGLPAELLSAAITTRGASRTIR